MSFRSTLNYYTKGMDREVVSQPIDKPSNSNTSTNPIAKFLSFVGRNSYGINSFSTAMSAIASEHSLEIRAGFTSKALAYDAHNLMVDKTSISGPSFKEVFEATHHAGLAGASPDFLLNTRESIGYILSNANHAFEIPNTINNIESIATFSSLFVILASASIMFGALHYKKHIDIYRDLRKEKETNSSDIKTLNKPVLSM